MKATSPGHRAKKVKVCGFELRVVPAKDGTYRLALLEHPPADSASRSAGAAALRSALMGWHLQVAEGAVRTTLERCGYRGIDLRWSRRTPFYLPEEEGMRLDLLFRAVSRMNKRTRMEDVIIGLRSMGREELSYWHAKATHVNGGRPSDAIRAFRLLFGGAA